MGFTFTTDVLWGLQGMFVNLVEAILAAIFYTGIFEVRSKSFLKPRDISFLKVARKTFLLMIHLGEVDVDDGNSTDGGGRWLRHDTIYLYCCSVVVIRLYFQPNWYK